MSEIDSILIRDEDDHYAPPSKSMLNITVLGDILSIDIVKYDENFQERRLETIEQMAVDLESFKLALNTLEQAQRLYDKKARNR